MKHILNVFVLMLMWVYGFSQSQDQNYIRTTTYIKDGNTAVETIQYFDGLGRPVETVQRGFSPTSQDLVTLTAYDGVGREYKQWLPVPNSGNGGYIDSLAVISKASAQYNDGRPFNQTIYEPSPLNRVLQQKGPGAAWDTHPVTIDYQANTSGEVKRFYITGSGELAVGVYDVGTLYKTVTKDEDNKSITEYKDKLERVVMQRQGTNVDTYYVYNDLGQLAYVLPPLAADANGTPDAINKYGYVYEYDTRGNCICKKLPGCDSIYMVYDKAERLIASQDGNQRKKNQWTINKYDVLGRLIYTALLIRPVSLEQMGNTLNPLLIIEHYDGSSSFSNTGYTCGYFTNELIPILVNYYDDYAFLDLPAMDSHKTKLSYQAKEGYSTQYTPPSGGRGAAGLLTGTRVYELSDPAKYTVTAMYYEDKGNVVQTRSSNHLGGYDIVYNNLDFTGKPKETLKEHNIAGQTVISELYTYDYDHAGRLIQTKYKLKDTEITLAANTYDELGRLTGKTRHNGEDIEEYEYNIRNWTTRIKSGEFEEKLYYNTNLPNSCTSYYNGNISATTWTYNTAVNGYHYSYDALNRLLSETNLAVMDLSFDYNGNQLIKISDDFVLNQYNVKEYQNKSNEVVEFSYDKNGNMTTDLDRDIVTIKYNLLNLPDTIQFKNGNQIINHYDAGGQKLAATILTGISPIVVPVSQIHDWNNDLTLVNKKDTKYVGNMEYSFTNNIPKRGGPKVYNTEGYSPYTTAIYFYYYRRDHLGSIREIWQGGRKFTHQRTQYYPSGLPWAEGQNPSTQQRKYNGKEWIEAHGLDEYDSQARMYYPAIMRTTTIDPLAEKYYSISPYAWCGNNPVNRIDPYGMDIYIFDGISGKYIPEERIEMDSKRLATKTTDKDGNVTYTFYDFADPDNDSQDIDNGDITRLEFVSERDVENIIKEKGGFNLSNSGLVPFAVKSRGMGGFDYATGGIIDYMESKGRVNLLNNSLYIPTGDTYAHNWFNFGNFLWGATGYALGFSEEVLLKAADLNSRYNPFGLNSYPRQPDSIDDQLSISRGVKFAGSHSYRKKAYPKWLNINSN